MKHTPGPWTFCGDANARRIIIWQQPPVRGENRRVAEILPKISPETTDANARLIAAAPDLLEACREALDLGNIQTNRPGKHGGLAYKVGNTLMAAIAKATGVSENENS